MISEKRKQQKRKYEATHKGPTNYNKYKRTAKAFINLNANSQAGEYMLQNPDLYTEDLQALKYMIDDKLKKLSTTK